MVLCNLLNQVEQKSLSPTTASTASQWEVSLTKLYNSNYVSIPKKKGQAEQTEGGGGCAES